MSKEKLFIIIGKNHSKSPSICIISTQKIENDFRQFGMVEENGKWKAERLFSLLKKKNLRPILCI
jgi:hypothetical protein